MIKAYEMSEEDYKQLLEACKAVPYMVVGGIPPTSPQENANRAWQALGKKMGFIWDTATGTGGRTFTAEPIPERMPGTISEQCSEEAHARVDVARMRELTEQVYLENPDGLTADEAVSKLCAKGHKVDALSIRPRVTELRKRDVLMLTTKRRPNDKGNNCAVLKHKDFAIPLLLEAVR